MSSLAYTGAGSGGGSVNVFNLGGEYDFSNFRWNVSGGEGGTAQAGELVRGGNGGTR